jgi:hypothetical protein
MTQDLLGLPITYSMPRDASHATAHQFTEDSVRATVHALNHTGVSVIEVSHGDGRGRSSSSNGFSHDEEARLVTAAVGEAGISPKSSVDRVPASSADHVSEQRGSV